MVVNITLSHLSRNCLMGHHTSFGYPNLISLCPCHYTLYTFFLCTYQCEITASARSHIFLIRFPPFRYTSYHASLISAFANVLTTPLRKSQPFHNTTSYPIIPCCFSNRSDILVRAEQLVQITTNQFQNSQINKTTCGNS